MVEFVIVYQALFNESLQSSHPVSLVHWRHLEHTSCCWQVDERAVLKHFDWPEGKADALREAAFEFQDLSKLQRELENFEDDSNMPVEVALQKMFAVMEK